MIAILDTHTILWALENDPRLGQSAKKLIQSSKPKDLGCSDISLFEISMLMSKGRIQLRTSPIQYLNTITTSINSISISPAIATKSIEIPLPHSDPFDRLITATAKCLKLPLLTRDKLIADSQTVETIWH